MHPFYWLCSFNSIRFEFSYCSIVMNGAFPLSVRSRASAFSFTLEINFSTKELKQWHARDYSIECYCMQNERYKILDNTFEMMHQNPQGVIESKLNEYTKYKFIGWPIRQSAFIEFIHLYFLFLFAKWNVIAFTKIPIKSGFSWSTSMHHLTHSNQYNAKSNLH